METEKLPDGSLVVWRIEEWAESAAAELETRLRLASEEVRLRARELLSGGPGRSAPGAPPNADVGRLRDSVFAAVDAASMTAVVGTPLKYGLVLEYGTPGGTLVEAKPGSVLSWVDPRTGKRVYARWVRLGAIRPRPWLKLAVAESTPRVRAIMEAPFPEGRFKGA
jgi:hypothetical protein